MKKNNEYVLILAGGNGTRLWPISTTKKPKQYLKLYSDNIMINETINRIKDIFKYENIFVIINKEQENIAKKYIDYNVPRENILCEPCAKSTAMCIFFASIKIQQVKGNGTMTILSSDHYIEDKEKLKKTIIKGIKIANESNNLVTVGIKPTYPATGFGYIKFKSDIAKKYNNVQEFKEKPNYESAVKYIEEGNYYWNSGMFIWNINTILENFKSYLPEIYKYREDIEKAIGEVNEFKQMKDIYNKVKSISIDKGILEKSNKIKMLKGDFKWLDMGSINDFFKLREKDKENNVKIGNIIVNETEGTNIYNDNEQVLIATIGIENLNIINCNNVIFVSKKDKMNEASELIKIMKDDEKYKKFI